MIRLRKSILLRNILPILDDFKCTYGHYVDYITFAVKESMRFWEQVAQIEEQAEVRKSRDQEDCKSLVKGGGKHNKMKIISIVSESVLFGFNASFAAACKLIVLPSFYDASSFQNMEYLDRFSTSISFLD